MPSSEDLPTPEPAKMPRRWPRPQGTSASSARTPSDTRSSMRGRASGSGGAASAGRHARAGSGPGRRSGGRGRRARGRAARRRRRPAAAGRWRSRARPGRCPSASPSAISSVRPARKPTTSAGTLGAAAAGLDRADLADLGLEAGGLDDQADQVDDAARAAVQVGVAERLPASPTRSSSVDRVERRFHQREHQVVSAVRRGS